MIKTTAMLLLALVIGYGGVALARFSDADDAPGGMVVGWVIVLAAVALGIKALARKAS